MTADKLRGYRFSTQAQWDSCLLAQVARDSGTAALRPFAPYGQPAKWYPTPGAYAPVVTRAGEILWRNSEGALYRLSPGDDDQPEMLPEQTGIGRASRVIATASGLWVMGDPPQSLQKYEEDSLTRLMTVEIPNGRVTDIAGGGRDTIWTLVEGDGRWQAVRIDHAGHMVETVTLEGIVYATAFVFLKSSQQFVVLAGDRHPRLYWFPGKGESAAFSIAVGGMHPCFSATDIPCPPPGHVLGSDALERIFLAGKDDDEFGGGMYVLTFDDDGNLIGDVQIDPLDAPATGITATRDLLVVTGQRGLLRFAAVDVVPQGAGQVQGTLITPMLQSLDRQDRRRWLRVEASVELPEGSTLVISYAATDDPHVRDRLKAIAADCSLSMSRRINKLLSEPDLWCGRTVFHGSSPQPKDPPPFMAKLFDVSERYLWISVTLSAAAGAHLPKLTELTVLYPGHTLMESLPAIYQRDEARPDSFFRGLVGVLEATTQGLDARIASMGSQVHPSTAQGPWLDFIARWLGVPWDDALSFEQKKAIMSRAADLARGRGTRVGLEALLECLMPGVPRRFRVADATADFGFAMVSDEACTGSALPAMLSGRTGWNAELDATTAVLGSMRLSCDGRVDDGSWQLVGRVRIDVAATATERKAWEPWLLTMITEMVPLTARLQLRWVSAQALRMDLLDGTLTLDAPPTPHLGTDAVTGLAQLPERGSRTSASGPSLSTRLR
jgi:phage tail-like protein